METVIYIAVACLVGALLGYVFTKTRNESIVPVLKRENNVLQHNISRLEEELKSVGLQNSRLLTENGRLTGQLEQNSVRLEERNTEFMATSAKLTTAREELISAARQVQFQQENLERLKGEFQAMSATMRADFRNMADTILEEKTKKFTDLNEEKMRSVLEPLKSNLAEFKLKVEDTYEKESKQRFSLERELNRLMELNMQLGQEASNLTNALKQNNKVLGNWGEMILESLLENSGLTRGREYFVQEFLRDEFGNRVRDHNGSMLQPDITVQYPDGRKLIIDSKMSLLAYESYHSCVDQDAGGGFLKDHCQSLRSHIENLSRKEYPKYAGAALDLVILFIPLEPAYFLALRQDPTLWKY